MPYYYVLGAVLFAMIAFAMYLYIPILQAQVIGKSLVAQSRAYTQTPEHSTMKILVIGDSTAVGTGAPFGNSVAGYIGNDFPSATLVNDSKNGMKLEEFLTRLKQHKGEKYDLVVFQIGGNDIVGLTPPSEIQSLLLQALGVSDTIASTTIVVCSGNVGLAPAFKWPLSLLYEERSRDVFHRYAQTVKEYPSAHYVDLYRNRSDDIFLTDIPKYYAPDLFHPSGDGYAVWYTEIRKTINDSIKIPSST